jgi:hypothetical protein
MVWMFFMRIQMKYWGVVAVFILGVALAGIGGCHFSKRRDITSAIPIDLAAVERMNSGWISFECSKQGQVFVTVTDRFRDSHMHVLRYEAGGLSNVVAVLAAKKRELENAHWAILGGAWILESKAVPQILSGVKGHLEGMLGGTGSDWDRTRIQRILDVWDSYYCQLNLLLDKDGRKVVKLSFFPGAQINAFEGWRCAPIQVEGGGTGYWRLKYDVEKGEYFGFDVNAPK